MKDAITFRNGNYGGAKIRAGEHNTYRVFVDGEQIGTVAGISYPHEPGKSSGRYSQPGRWTGRITDDAGELVIVRAGYGWNRPYFNTRRRAAEAMIHRLGL